MGKERGKSGACLVVAEEPHSRRLVVLVVRDAEVVGPGWQDSVFWLLRDQVS